MDDRFGAAHSPRHVREFVAVPDTVDDLEKSGR
jgi:hypothetical protein